MPLVSDRRHSCHGRSGYFFFGGRNDDIINSAGYRIGPTEVENALIEHPDVIECAAVASPPSPRTGAKS